MSDRTNLLEEDIRGLDRLELPMATRPPWTVRSWRATWPKLLAAAIAIAIWQIVVWTGWKPIYVLPGPGRVFRELADMLPTERFWSAVGTTMRRAVVGFAVAVVMGTMIGLAVSQSNVLRRGVGSLIAGLQSMPSIVWFPFAILLFGITETAIFFVIILGAAPSIASGLISGVDHIPPVLLRAGSILGARGLTSWRHVVLPAALPSFVAGLKQGWAFSWRSLMAGELLVIIASRPSIGTELAFAREFVRPPMMLAMMIVVLFIGIVVDSLVFGILERRLRRNRGLMVSK
jgi:NitT/TauT family transport system permease protein